MLNIKEGNPWVLWPNHICDTFPEYPATKQLTGENNFVLSINMIVNKVEGVIGTLFTLLPHYTALDIYEGRLLFTLMNKLGETNYDELPHPIFDGVQLKVRIEHVAKEKIEIFISQRLVLSLDLTEKGFAIEDNPHIIFGAGNFPKNGFNLNYTDISLQEFKIEQDGNLLCHHLFEEFIFDKSVDITGNCNFINKI
jgi:hypothetical protein